MFCAEGTACAKAQEENQAALRSPLVLSQASQYVWETVGKGIFISQGCH